MSEKKFLIKENKCLEEFDPQQLSNDDITHIKNKVNNIDTNVNDIESIVNTIKNTIGSNSGIKILEFKEVYLKRSIPQGYGELDSYTISHSKSGRGYFFGEALFTSRTSNENPKQYRTMPIGFSRVSTGSTSTMFQFQKPILRETAGYGGDLFFQGTLIVVQ